MENQRTISEVKIETTVHQLKSPYILSFGSVKELDSVVVRMNASNGAACLAETVPLPGYSEETVESITNFLKSHVSVLEGMKIDDARNLISKEIRHNPFACSPILTCIDLLNGFEASGNCNPDFVVPFSAAEPSKMEQYIKQGIKKKSVTFKIKLSGDALVDCDFLSWLDANCPESSMLRLDANKAYHESDADVVCNKLMKTLLIERIECFEQAFPIEAWEAQKKLCGAYPRIPFMLDESIIDEDDLSKAYDCGIRIIKLKLFKQGGIKETIHLAELASRLGMKTIIGNGVATKLSNDIENAIYCKYPHLFFGCSEANGFLKLSA